LEFVSAIITSIKNEIIFIEYYISKQDFFQVREKNANAAKSRRPL